MSAPPPDPHEARILLVEDNPGDRRLIEEAFRNGHINNQLRTLADGQEALDFIHRKGEYEDAPRPDIILLDLHLPRVDGEDVLHEVKKHPELGNIPVIILSGVGEELIKSCGLGPESDEDAVLEKPIDPTEFVGVIRELDGFRLSVVCTDRE